MSYTFTDLYKNNNNIKVLLKEKCNYRLDLQSLQYYKEIIEFNNQDIIINQSTIINNTNRFKMFFKKT